MKNIRPTQAPPNFLGDAASTPPEAGASAAYYPHIESRHTGWQDKHSDELYVASEPEPDPQKPAAQYKEMQEIFSAAAPMLFLY